MCRLRVGLQDAVSICIQRDVGCSDCLCTDDLHHRQNNRRYENYVSKSLQRRSRQKQRGVPLDVHTFRI